MTREVPASVSRWLRRGDRGTSSETIVGRFLGIPLAQLESEPLDPDDLRRCARMLDDCPEVRAWFPAMAEVSPTWRRLVEQWDELVALMRLEAQTKGGMCPVTYRRMCEIRKVHR